MIIDCAVKMRSKLRVRCRWDRSDEWVKINDDCDKNEDRSEMKQDTSFCYIWLDFFWRSWNFAINCLTFSQFFFDFFRTYCDNRFSYFIIRFIKFSQFFAKIQKLCSSFHFFHFTRYWIIVIFSYFLFRFFRILSTSYDFSSTMSSFISIDSRLINRDRSYESDSDVDSNWAMKMTECIRDVADNFNSYAKLSILQKMMYESDR